MGGNIKIPSIGERQSFVKYVLPVVLLCILTRKEAKLRRRAMSEQILKSLFGTPRKTSDSWTEYTFDTFSASTWVSWNPIDPYSGGSICILYC